MSSFFRSTRDALQSLPALPRRKTRAQRGDAHPPQSAGWTANAAALPETSFPVPSAAQCASLAQRVEALAPYKEAAPAPPSAPAPLTDKPLPALPCELQRRKAVHYGKAPVRKPLPSPEIKRKPVSGGAYVDLPAQVAAAAPTKPVTPPPSARRPVDWAALAHAVANDCNIGDDEQQEFEAELAGLCMRTCVPLCDVSVAVAMVFPTFDTPDEVSEQFAALPTQLKSAVCTARRLNPLLPHFSSLERLQFFGALANLPPLAQARVYHLVSMSAPTLFAGAMDDLDAVRTLQHEEVATLMRQRAHMSPSDLAWLANIHGRPRATFLRGYPKDDTLLRRSVWRLSVRRENGATAFFKKGGVSANWDLQTPSD